MRSIGSVGNHLDVFRSFSGSFGFIFFSEFFEIFENRVEHFLTFFSGVSIQYFRNLSNLSMPSLKIFTNTKQFLVGMMKGLSSVV